MIAILLVDKDSIFFIKVAPPVPGGGLFAGASERAYLVLGCLIGGAGGPLQAAARTLLIRLAPKDRIAQYFGLFALTGKVTSFIGPLLIGTVTAATAEPEGGHGGADAVLHGRDGAADDGEGDIPSSRTGKRARSGTHTAAVVMARWRHSDPNRDRRGYGSLLRRDDSCANAGNA